MHPLEIYLQDLAHSHATGANVPELSFYPALANLLNTLGAELKPKVRAVISLKNQGAGLPDGGLFTASQFGRGAEMEPLPGQLPERGALEVKGPQADVRAIAQSPQVTTYLARYGLVLVTNLREFLLLGRDAAGRPHILESYTLAPDPDAFWQLTRRARAAVAAHGARLTEFLHRAMLTAAPLTEPKDVAWFLASYARDARAGMEAAGDLPALHALRQAMQDALAMDFASEKGEHFFRSTLVQTLFYGVFSAWVLWHHGDPAPGERFDWRLAAHLLKTPIIQALFHQLSDPAKLKALGLTEYLALTGATLNRVDRPAFFARFEAAQAVQYFYEPFLEAYDPALRKELGVWYTPPEIVQYMVERVDRVLRTELGLPDGLADPQVYVLDPCCGTGAYPLEVLKRIARTLREKGEDALLGYELKRAATERVFGFELLPAPFVIAHLQIGLLLQQSGATLADNERAAVYLTNALTGWTPPTGPKQALLLPELDAERDAAARVKRAAPILVVLGNPPYNAFAGVGDTDEEKELVKPYKEGLIETWGIKKFNLDDLYVRFVRLAEKRIVEQSGRGVLCYISSFSYLSDPSFVVLRERLLAGFDRFWFDCLNGDSRETGKTTPEGLPDPSVFSTSTNKEGIRVGTTIGLMVRRPHPNVVREGTSWQKDVRFRHFWGVTKRADLLASLDAPAFNAAYQPAAPMAGNRYSFRPAEVAAHYMEWPKVTELAVEYSNGLMEKRGGALMDMQKDALEKRMRAYFDAQLSWEDYKSFGYGLTEDAARFDAKLTRKKVLAAEPFKPENLRRYLLRPFDVRWCYYSGVRPLWNEPRPTLWAQCWDGNEFFMTRFSSSKDDEGVPFYWTLLLNDDHCLAPDATAFPLRLKQSAPQTDLFSTGTTVRANLSDRARAYLAGLGIADPDSDVALENGVPPYALIWCHALAIGYAPAYLRENKDGIQSDWPRLPLPAARETLLHSAALGQQIALTLTSQGVRPEFADIAVLRRVDGGQINPQAGDLALEAGWGHAQGAIVMPGQGKIIPYEIPQQVEDSGHPSRVDGSGVPNLFGESQRAYDIYLNDRVYWHAIPEAVWEYVIGGYQVLKKWLAYREKKILGRDLTVAEAREVTAIARRLAALIALEPALDENYRRCTSETQP